ncbi:MAG: hypothetical protein NC225_03115 [Clostridium sp.]|nr:hypothetical protein [Clostridium sp.]MCM1398455.1 hypothetical protein [Clostridium sp.]MCM1460177.1 hypothetical protein [Bacteroides sp.]
MKRVIKTVVMALVGAILGIILGSLSIFGADKRFWILFCMGVPIGWSFLGKYFGQLVTNNFPLMIFLLLMRAMLAGIIGWVLIPVEIVRGFIEVLGNKGEEEEL